MQFSYFCASDSSVKNFDSVAICGLVTRAQLHFMNKLDFIKELLSSVISSMMLLVKTHET